MFTSNNPEENAMMMATATPIMTSNFLLFSMSVIHSIKLHLLDTPGSRKVAPNKKFLFTRVKNR